MPAATVATPTMQGSITIDRAAWSPIDPLNLVPPTPTSVTVSITGASFGKTVKLLVNGTSVNSVAVSLGGSVSAVILWATLSASAKTALSSFLSTSWTVYSGTLPTTGTVHKIGDGTNTIEVTY